MPTPFKSSLQVAALASALGVGLAGAAPDAMRLLPAGEFRATDGRPKDVEAWVLTEQLAKALMARVAARKDDVLVDYEHQSLNAATNGQPAPAAAWFKTLEWRDPAQFEPDVAGLWALNVGWTAKAAASVAAKEIRYVSPVFTYNKAGQVIDLVSVAITNTPALDGLSDLAQRAALSLAGIDATDFSTKGVDMTKELEAQVAALTKERDELKAAQAKTTQSAEAAAQTAALTKERDELATKSAALTKELEEIKAAKAKAEQDAAQKAHADVLQAALTSGAFTPADKAWLEKLDLATLTDAIKVRKPLAMLTKQTDGSSKSGDAAHGLTAVELAMCSRMGVEPEAFAKTKADEAKRVGQAAA